VNLSIHTALLVQSQRYKYRGYTNSLFRLLAVILFQNCQSSLAVVSNLETEQASSFAPLPLQELHHYYGLVRHRNLTVSQLCAPFTQQSRFPPEKSGQAVSIIKAWIRVPEKSGQALLSLSRWSLSESKWCHTTSNQATCSIVFPDLYRVRSVLTSLSVTRPNVDSLSNSALLILTWTAHDCPFPESFTTTRVSPVAAPGGLMTALDNPYRKASL
jgi:hypothetical protein